MADNDYGLFWNSVNGDRKYDADSFEIWAKKFFTTGVFNGDLQVTADGGMNVLVGTGYCCIEGKVKFFDTAVSLTISSPSGVYPRIDNVVIERDDINRRIIAKVQEGALTGDDPTAPEPIRENGVYQIVLAQIYVSANATEIRQDYITDKRADNSVCGWIVGTVSRVDVQQMTAQAEADFENWYEAVKDQLSEDAAGHLQLEIDDINDKIDRTAVAATMTATGWNNAVYSFESSYPSTTYDIEIEPNGDAITTAQLDAWGQARLVGSVTTNTVKACGTVPSIDIPIVIKAVKK
ncbi:MAG: hypothetical protein IJ120_02700 [Solobacterium sp.]|nr:hypothetical protein [Solobacterium sp.]